MARPVALTVTTWVSDELHTAEFAKFWVPPLL
jgi:hypothetical protein